MGLARFARRFPTIHHNVPARLSKVLNIMLRGGSKSGLSRFFIPQMEWS